MKTMRSGAVLVLCCLVLAGCYTRQPLATVAPAPNTRIVATVTDSGAVAMGAVIGAGAMVVEGIVASADDSEWMLQMVRVEHRDGRTIPWNREQVAFPRTALASPTVVTLNRRQSWLVAGGITAGALIVAQVFGLLFGGDADDRDGPTPPPQQGVWPGGRR